MLFWWWIPRRARRKLMRLLDSLGTVELTEARILELSRLEDNSQ